MKKLLLAALVATLALPVWAVAPSTTTTTVIPGDTRVESTTTTTTILTPQNMEKEEATDEALTNKQHMEDNLKDVEDEEASDNFMPKNKLNFEDEEE